MDKKRREKASVGIQRVWRGKQTRLEAARRKRKEEEERAALKIETRWRTHEAKRRVQQRRERAEVCGGPLSFSGHASLRMRQ